MNSVPASFVSCISMRPWALREGLIFFNYVVRTMSRRFSAPGGSRKLSIPSSILISRRGLTVGGLRFVSLHEGMDSRRRADILGAFLVPASWDISASGGSRRLSTPSSMLIPGPVSAHRTQPAARDPYERWARELLRASKNVLRIHFGSSRCSSAQFLLARSILASAWPQFAVGRRVYGRGITLKVCMKF